MSLNHVAGFAWTLLVCVWRQHSTALNNLSTFIALVVGGGETITPPQRSVPLLSCWLGFDHHLMFTNSLKMSLNKHLGLFWNQWIFQDWRNGMPYCIIFSTLCCRRMLLFFLRQNKNCFSLCFVFTVYKYIGNDLYHTAHYGRAMKKKNAFFGSC